MDRGWLREKGWTLAGIILVGVVLFVLFDFIYDMLCFGVASLINTTSMVVGAVPSVVNADVKTEVITVGNYTAELSTVNAEREGLTFVGRVYEVVSWMFKQFVKLISSKELFLAIMILSFAIIVYENMVGEE